MEDIKIIKEFFSKPLDEINGSSQTEWPKEVPSRYGDIIFRLVKVMPDRAKYELIDAETGKTWEVGGRVYGTVNQLKASAEDTIKPQGGRQSSQFESVNEAKTYKKGDKLKIKLKNGKEFDLTFDSYGRQKGMAFGKFKDGSGEYDTKPFNLDTIVESVNEELNLSNYGKVTPPKGGASLVGKYNSIQGKSKYDTVIFDYQEGSDKPYGIVQVEGHGIYGSDLLKRLGLRQTRSWTAGVDVYIHDGNYTPVYVSEDDFKALLDFWSGGLDREAKAQADFYRNRGNTSGTIDEAKVDYDFSERELIRVLRQLKRGASTEVDMIKAFTKVLGRELTKDELFSESIAKINEATEDAIDAITMDVPLFIRILEYSREDAQEDMDLHDVAEKAILLNKEKGILSMEDYNEIVGRAEEIKEGIGNEVGDKVYFKGDMGEKYPFSQGYYGIIEDTTPARNYNMMATYDVVVYDKNDNEIRTITTDFTNLTNKKVNESEIDALAKELANAVEDKLEDKKDEVNEVIDPISILSYVLAGTTLTNIIAKYVGKLSKKYNFGKGEAAAKKIYDFTHKLESDFKKPIGRVVGLFTKDEKQKSLVTDGLFALLLLGLGAKAGTEAFSAIRKSNLITGGVSALKAALKGKDLAKLVQDTIQDTISAV